MSDTRTPKYGDEIMIPSEHPDGHWTNGTVNSGIAGSHEGGKMLVASHGHAKSNLVSVRVKDYVRHWCWPEDVGAKASGIGKPVLLEDLQG